MKKIFSLLLAASAFACTQEKVVEITISNPSTTDRTNEITEITSDAITKLKGETFIISDNTGSQVPYQITYDNKIIFPVSVKGGENVTYKITPGTPEAFKTIACGKQYPERVDDIAWENDRIAFRTYGPALQATGEKAYGCDIWVKCVSEPIVDMRYKTELDPETRAKIAELRKTDPKAAQQLSESVSYHILDNGPLRFTVKLVYNPLTVKGNNNVIENRIISLDAGSQMNKFTITYDNLTEATPVVTGIVLHEPSKDYQADTAKGYIAYADPADPVNGQIYVAAVFPEKVNEAKAITFSDKEKAERGADGHVLAYSTYTPGCSYTYYSGAGWSKWGFENSSKWFDYVQKFAQNLKEPLTVTIK